ncbi:MAG: hypothetical protein K6G67_06230 [Lachnospiraceae bacterium]|nr:hypothetical protein [Lachnospiraceae bacterium]
MATYLVDYENVHHSGLLGMEALSEEDKIVVFYSDNGETIPIYLLDNCSASFDFRRVVAGTSNALDFQLVGYLFHEMKPEEVYYIISRDTGYDMIVPMAKSFGNTIIRKTFIGEDDEIWENSPSYVYVKSKMALFQKKDINEKIRNICGIYGIKDSEKVKDPDRYGVDVRLMDTTIQVKISNSIEDRIGTKPSTETVELLIRGLAGCDNRQDFYIFCLRNLGETAGYNFYKKVRSSFEEMVSVVRVAS